MGGPHDGDNNIFPGNAASLNKTSGVKHIRLHERAYLGEIVPHEDSDKLDRLTEVIELEFEYEHEKFRYTHNREKVVQLHGFLKDLERPTSTAEVYVAWYNGHSFRDGVNRVSMFEA
jgi:hypothetical protein